MKVQFYIRFYTQPGESIFVSGNIAQLGNQDISAALPLSYLDREFWYGTIDVDPTETAKVQYSYIFRNASGENTLEGGEERIADITKTGVEFIRLVDSWNHAGDYENVFFTSPFQNVLLKNAGQEKTKVRTPKTFTHIFKVKSPLLAKHEMICLCGNTSLLGAWDTDAPVLLSRENEWWSVKLNVPLDGSPLTYKYGVFNRKEKKFVCFESGGNRQLRPEGTEKQLTIVHDGFARLTNDSWKGAGVSVPVFSLRSKDSFGIGEFNDLKLLADWASRCGLKLIQLLPVNDTTATHTWTDSYPYAAISAFALHPIYIHLDSIAGKRHDHLLKAHRKKQKQLNELAEVDYEQVESLKLSAAKELFAEQQETFLQEEEFLTFFEEHKHWLIPYAAFCYLRDRNGTADFSQWKLYGRFDRAAIEKYVSPKAKHYENIAFTYFLQYHLHLQLKDAVEYAHELGIIIKGDMPIGVYRYGCDAWMEPELFHSDMQAGAPPDPFAVKGQNWGFPTYNWDRMAQNHFEWWKKRFVQMGNYFDSFRIDHILGFFRIWSIPVDAIQGIMGRFVPALPVHVYEFGQRGMWFNYHRFCTPYITDTVLWELFGPNKNKFRQFLFPSGNGQYHLKEEFSAQRRVEEYFKGLEDSEENRRICEGILELISNVILFEEDDSNGQKFHFRIGMESTASFRHLDWNMQAQLRELYIDYYYRRQDGFWKKEAMKKLPALKRATNMLICGEDLGMVPYCVPDVMKQLGILSLEIQRMPKGEGREFFHPSDAPYLSVVTPSTHDMSTIRSWWQEDPERTQRFFNSELGCEGAAPASCESWISRAVFLQHIYSPAMWSIFQLQDILAMHDALRRGNPDEERINEPSIPQYYWRYRMHITLEQALKEKEFNDQLKQDIKASGR